MMKHLDKLMDLFAIYVPFLTTLAGLVVMLWLLHRYLIVKAVHLNLNPESRLPRQLLMLFLTLCGIVLLILVFPMSDNTRGQVLSLLGILLTAVIAISSTTFVSNAMGGMMLRVIKSFRPGDFIKVGDKFGKVSARGLFHTEIQTEDHDLVTFPNLHLITNPVTVISRDGTIISATLSLGYDVPRKKVESLMKEAAEKVGLQQPFVLLVELNDYSASYRVAGFLEDVSHLLTMRSKLRKTIMDVLHDAHIEIVSPVYMNQRVLHVDKKVVSVSDTELPAAEHETPAETIMFAKAEKAGQVQEMKDGCAVLEARNELLQDHMKEASETEQETFTKEIAVNTDLIEKLKEKIKILEKED